MTFYKLTQPKHKVTNFTVLFNHVLLSLNFTVCVSAIPEKLEQKTNFCMYESNSVFSKTGSDCLNYRISVCLNVILETVFILCRELHIENLTIQQLLILIVMKWQTGRALFTSEVSTSREYSKHSQESKLMILCISSGFIATLHFSQSIMEDFFNVCLYTAAFFLQFHQTMYFASSDSVSY